MNRQFAEKIISALKDDLKNVKEDSALINDMYRAEKLFGKEIPEITDCMEEVRDWSCTIQRNAQTIIDLLEMRLADQAILSFNLADFQIKDSKFYKLIQQSFQFYKEAKINIATEKAWDAFERIKTCYQPNDKKASANKLINAMSKNCVEYNKILEKEFLELTGIGNDFRIRHHETIKKDIRFNEHYDYLFYRCLSILKLAASTLSKEP